MRFQRWVNGFGFSFCQSRFGYCILFLSTFLSMSHPLYADPNISRSVVSQKIIQSSRMEVFILGVAQDAGYPQINCYKPHCMPGWEDVTKRRMATSLALVDHRHKSFYLFEATPDIKQQLYQVYRQFGNYHLAGIFLTHAHMGHYTGLMHLGREAQGASNIPVYAMPRMIQFLSDNGPWSQLVKLKNIQLNSIQNNQAVEIADGVAVIPFIVPHRDEFSETVGFKIVHNNKSLLFIPDIDKWRRWKTDVRPLIEQVDYALLDATFYAAGEIKNRDMSEIPHPFVEESMLYFSSLSKADKRKVHFIHFNHSNPLLIENSEAQADVLKAGYRFAKEGMRIKF
ncbi:MAG: MBL fold metallo-hydrolase [Enterobacterales bacterium]|nr:MBL fold metallo-hydrolase [Enterobacterales bacterium]